MKRELKDVIRANVLRLLRERGLSKAVLARKMRRDKSLVTKFLEDQERDLKSETIQQFANALGVHSAVLVSDGGDSPSSAGPGPPTARFPSGGVLLTDKFKVSRPPDYPAGSYHPEVTLEMFNAPNGDQLRELLLRPLTEAGPPWSILAGSHALSMKKAYLLKDFRPFKAPAPSGSVPYAEGAPKLMRDDVLYSSAWKLLVEPRTGLSMLDGDRACVHQAAYVITARECCPIPARKALLRLAAFFMCTDYQRQLPAVRWDDRSYRPRVGHYRALAVAASMFTNNREWRTVDSTISEVMARMRWEGEEDDPGDIVSMCLRLRCEALYGTRLEEVVSAAVHSV